MLVIKMYLDFAQNRRISHVSFGTINSLQSSNLMAHSVNS